jgi:hypothetical protein
VNNEAKWDYPDSYYENEEWGTQDSTPPGPVNTNRRKVISAIRMKDDKVYDGTKDFDPTKYFAKTLPIAEEATKLAKKRTWTGDTDTVITTRCFVFKNPLDDDGKPTRFQNREELHVWFSFKLNIGVTITSAVEYMVVRVVCSSSLSPSLSLSLLTCMINCI